MACKRSPKQGSDILLRQQDCMRVAWVNKGLWKEVSSRLYDDAGGNCLWLWRIAAVAVAL